ncbi:MAG: hypothetical protein EHM23_28610, partial [Acidobacteria bacterium]
MAKQSEEDRLRLWRSRVSAADKVYKKWAEEFQCDKLERYYLGHQWPEDDSDHYTINLIYPSIESRKPSLLFYKPPFKVIGTPTRIDDDMSVLQDRARFQEDTLNSFVRDPRLDFEELTQLGVHEAHFRFAVMEIGYSADFMDNPNFTKPALDEEGNELKDASGETVTEGAQGLEPEVVIDSEALFLKRVPAKQFRVSLKEHNLVKKVDWVGYYEWVYSEDVRRNPRYKNTSSLKTSGKINEEFEPAGENPEEDNQRRGMTKLWKIWDLRTRTKLVFDDSNSKRFFLEEPFKIFPFAVLRMGTITDRFYPLPPVYNWLSPQDELNETREQQRIHRKRFNRRYLYLDGQIDVAELEKLETGGDGVYAKATRTDALVPVPDAPLDPAVVRNIPQTKEDFQEISGVAGEQRGVAESETATQANIISVRSRIRENYGRSEVGKWLGQIGRIMLEMAIEYMALPFWIRRHVDPNSPAAPLEAMQVAQMWEQITAGELGDRALDVEVDLAFLSPVSEEAERASWMQVMGLMKDPQFLMIMASSEMVCRKTLGLYGIRSEAEIKEFQRLAQMAVMMAAQAQ